MKTRIARLSFALVAATCLWAGVVGVASAQKQGKGGTAAQGAAGGSTSVGADGIERCEQSLGTLAVDDGRDKAWSGDWSRSTGVTSVEPMIRLIAQQSNCFVITSAGNTRLDNRMADISGRQRESGEYRAGSNQQAGQRVASDYYLEPSIFFANSDAGGLGGAIGGMLGGRLGGALGGAAMKKKHTTVNLALFDLRSGVQLSAAEGSASTSELSGAIGGVFGLGGGALAGYTKTPEGKSTVAAFVDGYNQMVVALKNYKAQEVQGGLGTGGVLKVN